MLERQVVADTGLIRRAIRILPCDKVITFLFRSESGKFRGFAVGHFDFLPDSAFKEQLIGKDSLAGVVTRIKCSENLVIVGREEFICQAFRQRIGCAEGFGGTDVDIFRRRHVRHKAV